jgi:hypothetical protein
MKAAVLTVMAHGGIPGKIVMPGKTKRQAVEWVKNSAPMFKVLKVKMGKVKE